MCILGRPGILLLCWRLVGRRVPRLGGTGQFMPPELNDATLRAWGPWVVVLVSCVVADGLYGVGAEEE